MSIFIFLNLYFIIRNIRIWTGNVHVCIVKHHGAVANKDDKWIFLPYLNHGISFSEHNNFDLLSYTLGAEDNKTAPQGRIPQREGKDKQHNHKNCLYDTQYSDDVYLKIDEKDEKFLHCRSYLGGGCRLLYMPLPTATSTGPVWRN